VPGAVAQARLSERDGPLLRRYREYGSYGEPSDGAREIDAVDCVLVIRD